MPAQYLLESTLDALGRLWLTKSPARNIPQGEQLMGPHGETQKLAAQPPTEGTDDAVAAVRELHPNITQAQAGKIAALQAHFQGWEVFPHVSFPTVNLWYARKRNCQMETLRRYSLAEMPAAIDEWTLEHMPDFDCAGYQRWAGWPT
jgi:hypothetical protein